MFQRQGSELFHFQARAKISSLRERGISGFNSLPKREAEVGDCIINGMSVSGTALELGVKDSTIIRCANVSTPNWTFLQQPSLRR
ncbi:hypothetical protein N8760_07280 [Rhodobacteraceae bacterium]|nr:hypothetical protein [Paracoccaceae bacterium]